MPDFIINELLKAPNHSGGFFIINFIFSSNKKQRLTTKRIDSITKKLKFI